MPAKRSPKASPPSEAAEPRCSFCNKTFKREKSLLDHRCEKKARFLDRDERHVKFGLFAYQRFYAVAMRGSKPPDYDAFMRSQFYTAFVKFGRYVLDINAINPTDFIDFLIKAEVKVDHWTHQNVYATYLRELSKRESADAALERNLLLMQQWAVDTGHPWIEYFRMVPAPLAVMQIRSGRISPWVLYTASSGLELLGRLTPEQMDLVQDAIDPAFWETKLDKHADEVEVIRSVLDEAGL